MDCHDSLIRHLLETVRCSVCSATYAFDNVSVLGHQDELWFLTVTCPDCRTQGVIAALVRGEDGAQAPPGGSASVDGLAVAEASVSEAPPTGEPISAADVDAMREFLAGFRGNLAALVSQR